MDIDISDFQDALTFVEKATGRPMAVSLNRAAKTVIIGGKGVKGAMQLTPKANKAAIKMVPEKEIAGFVAAKLRKAGVKITREIMAREVEKERARRIRASGYTAYAGWSNAARAFGGRGVKGVGDSQKKLAKHGYGHVATPAALVAEIANTAPAAETVGFEALQQAVNNAAADLVEYGVRKLQEEVFNKVTT